MNRYIDILENLLTFNDEYEWFDFKENWVSKDEIGEYISAISNGAAFRGKILKISRVSNYRLIEYILNMIE